MTERRSPRIEHVEWGLVRVEGLQVPVHVLETREAVLTYDRLVAEGRAVGRLFLSTCQAWWIGFELPCRSDDGGLRRG